jgi:predicted branched-subunit amino acid permease
MTGLLPKIVIDSFGIAIYAAFLGLLLPSVRESAQLVILVVITALINWFLQCFIPKSWSVILAMILGASIGVFLVDDETISTEPSTDLKEEKETESSGEVGSI